MDPETQREFIGDIGREADRLGRLTQKLLTLTKLDSSVEEEREILDAAPVVRKVVRMLLPLARLRGIGIDTTFEPDCSVMTVEDDLYQIVFNLTENAIKYNRQDGWVGVSVRRAGDQVELRVEDNGAGIPPESMEHIFERFYRVDKARSRAAGGAGLGLSIVHDMVERSYGTITVQARPGGGTIFTVRFPHFDLEEDEHETPAAFAAPACAAVRLHHRARRAGGRPVFLLLPLRRGRLWRRGRRDPRRGRAARARRRSAHRRAAIPEGARLAGAAHSPARRLGAGVHWPDRGHGGAGLFRHTVPEPSTAPFSTPALPGRSCSCPVCSA